MLQTAASGVNSLGQDPKEKADKPEADPLSAAKAIALRQLSMAAKTRYQLEQSLTKKGFTPEIIRVSLDRLTEVGLIDDLAYAGMLVRSRCVTKKVSRSVLRMELRQKDISDDSLAVLRSLIEGSVNQTELLAALASVLASQSTRI